MKTLNPLDVHDLHQAGEIHLVDVREANEWAQRRIPGAIHAPLSNLPALLSGLPTDKPVVFHCLAGGRSAQAVMMARQLGYNIDSHMGGGLNAWLMHRLPTE